MIDFRNLKRVGEETREDAEEEKKDSHDYRQLYCSSEDSRPQISITCIPAPKYHLKTLPIDQGIIHNLKLHYRKRVILKFIKAIDRDWTRTLTSLTPLIC